MRTLLPLGPPSAAEGRRPQPFYGWFIVAVAALALCLSGPGQSYSVAEFINVYIRQFHMSRAEVSTLFSAATTLSGVLMFFAGRHVDRLGYRRSLVVVTVLFALACVANSFVNGALTLLVGFFLVRFLGQGSMTLVPNAVVPQWFVRQRGRALSRMSLGSLLGAAAIPLINTRLIAMWGWPWVWRFWAAVLLVVMLPAALWVVRDTPEAVGLMPDGEPPVVGLSHPARHEAAPSFTLREALRTRAFWLIALCAVVPAMLHTAITIQLFSILGSDGIPTSAASYMLSLFAIVSFGGTLLSGYLLDRIRTEFVLAAGFAIMVVEMLTLITAHTVGQAVLFAVAWGIASGLLNVTFAFVWPTYFGRTHLASIRGAITTFMVLGTAIGPALFGWSYDLFGGYNQVLIASLCLPAAAALVSLLTRRPAPPAAAVQGAD